MDKKLEVEGLLGGLECHLSLQQTWNLEIGEALAVCCGGIFSLAALRLKMEAKEALGESWSSFLGRRTPIGCCLLEKWLLDREWIEDLKTIWLNGEMLGLAILM